MRKKHKSGAIFILKKFVSAKIATYLFCEIIRYKCEIIRLFRGIIRFLDNLHLETQNIFKNSQI